MSDYYLEDFSVGQRFVTDAHHLTEADIKRFASEFDPQPFHLDENAASDSLFGGLAASGWHTAALTMKLMVEGPFQPVGGLIGAGVEEIRWVKPVRPGDQLTVSTEVIDIRRSRSNPQRGILKIRTTTFNQHGETVQEFVGNMVTQSRSE